MAGNDRGHGITLSTAGVLITLGIIFGDIGTSPIYVLNAIVSSHVISAELVLGGLSCVFWTLILITTIKYVFLSLNADNRGEGGIFALYALVRRYKVTWTIFPAIIGCASLIADGFITPPISISSAIEGLRILDPGIPTVPIVLAILVGLFVFQQFGTRIVGGIFGPVMLIWFTMIGILGAREILIYPQVLKALNPYYAINLLVKYPGGFWLLGAVFLCTTGGEALYSDLGHCGKPNIRVSWVFVLAMLLLSYFGQSAFLLSHYNGKFWPESASTFYSLMPSWFLPIGITVATLATIIASQALITGSFTLVNEAMKLRLWPNMKVIYPTTHQGQMYIPAINWFLFFGCVAVVLIFRESGNMEAAYGLAITINMLMTTMLLTYLMYVHRRSAFIVWGIPIMYITIETAFFVSNLMKFSHGGWFTFMLAIVLFLGMWIFYQARQLRKKHIEFVEIKDYINPLKELMHDETIPKEANNLVYMSMANDKSHIDSNIIYSIFRKRPKRADIYWFVHVDISNEPFGATYSVDTVVPRRIFFVRLSFGFKVEHKVNLMFNKIVEEMVKSGEVDELSHYPSLRKYNMPADFKFILLNSRVAIDDALTPLEQFIIKGYRFIKSISLSTAEDFGLELTNVEEETIPIRIAPSTKIELQRVT
ncbi:MAG TPA: KUP/HAK/KT family potassium transporter [Chitinophagales bacterium]|nr:KUP/HAK/KT family potassium transporter [Chitinophagales bacterium]